MADERASAEGEKKPEVIVITGMSGAGRTEAMHTFEDLGYFCIDNLPPTLLLDLVSLAGVQSGSMRKLAVVCDLRMKDFFSQLVGSCAVWMMLKCHTPCCSGRQRRVAGKPFQRIAPSSSAVLRWQPCHRWYPSGA